jgi:hypothetical protein
MYEEKEDLGGKILLIECMHWEGVMELYTYSLFVRRSTCIYAWSRGSLVVSSALISALLECYMYVVLLVLYGSSIEIYLSIGAFLFNRPAGNVCHYKRCGATRPLLDFTGSHPVLQSCS